jgi:membrane-bound lytic murein transglycosylase D
MNYYEEHNLYTSEVPKNYGLLDTLIIRKQATLENISRYTNIPAEDLLFLNPDIKTGVIPASQDGYILRLPLNTVMAFMDHEQDIYMDYPTAVTMDAVVSSNTNEDPNSKTLFTYTNSTPTEDMSGLNYTVKAGDNLGLIADAYDCTTQNLRDWNLLTSNTLVIGQKLNVYVATASVDKYKNIDLQSAAQKQAVAQATSTSGDPVKYKVHSGDSISKIADKYDVSVDSVLRANHLKKTSKIYPGQILKIEM